MFKKQSKFVVEDTFHDKTELVLEIFKTATDILPTSVDLNSRLKQYLIQHSFYVRELESFLFLDLTTLLSEFLRKGPCKLLETYWYSRPGNMLYSR